ncbi:MAG: hypothetical protein AAF806_31735 [Bacteroidota bacterium]
MNEKENDQYIEIHTRLVYYVGKRKKLIPNTTSFDEYMEYTVEDKYPVRNALYKNIHLIEDYIEAHSDILSEEDKAIIREFKHFRQGTFYVVKMTKKSTHFLGKKYVYEVHALRDPFQLFFGNKVPVMVDTVLLPFKGKIIYDGILSTYSIRFGGGISSSLKNEYALAEGKYGVITSLPEKIDEIKAAHSVERELLAMMKTKSSRAYNEYAIEDLLLKHPELRPTYIREWGRANARNKRKILKSLGIEKRWFALVNDTIIASANSERELRKETQAMTLDDEQRKGIYYFKV